MCINTSNNRKCTIILLHLIVILLLIISISSCNKDNKENIDKEISYIYLDSLSNQNVIENNLDKCHFLKLQTVDECLIKEIVKIEFDGDKIFIQDANEKIFVFDNNGYYLNSIGKIGHGPEEQLGIFDFYIDKQKKTVNIFDMYKSTMFIYNYLGDLLHKKNIKKELVENVSRFNLLDDTHLLMTLDNDNHSLFNYGILNTKKMKRENFIPYIVTGSMNLGFGQSKVAQVEGKSYLAAFLSDTIYGYNNHDIIPKWIFKGKQKPATKDDFKDKDYDLAIEAISTAKQKKRSIGIENLYSTEKIIHFTFTMFNESFRVFFNTQLMKGTYSKIVATDNVYTTFFNLIATTEEAFVCAISSYSILESEELEHNLNIKELLSNTTEDDNPILVFYYFE